MSFRKLACSLGIVSVVGAGAAVVADEPSGAEWRAAGEAASAPQEGFALGDLSRLAHLEAMSGNGGAEDDIATITAGYDKKDGFFIGDRNKEHFLLKFGAQLQIRYTYKGRDQRGDTFNTAPPGPASLAEVGSRDSSSLEIERVRLKFSGHILNPDLTYTIQLDGDTDAGSTVRAIDAYVLYHAGEYFGGENKAFSIGAGQWKTAFLRQEPTSSSALQMVERSLANEFFNIDRNLGLWVQGDLGMLFYSLSVVNAFDSVGVGPAAIDQVPAFVGRLVLNLVGDESPSKYEESNIKCEEKPFFSIGGSFATDQNNGTSFTAAQQDFKCYTFGLDTAFKFSVFSMQAEYMGRWLDYEAGNTAAEGETSALYAHGFYVQAGVFLWPQVIELAGRVSAIWTDSGPFQGNAVEAGPGLNWYISKSHKVKLQTDVMFYDISADLPNQTESLEVTGAGATSSSPFSSSAANFAEGEQGIMWRTQLQIAF
ncbi:MAG TPA: porin [Planctomycetota bacterium]|nr:porin [Planctomycetota bacterium]